MRQFIDPVTGSARQMLGGLIFAGVRTARRRSRATSRRSSRRRASARSTASTTRPCCAAAGACTSRRGTIRPPARPAGARSATRRRPTCRSRRGVPTVTMSNPFPNGLVQPSGNTLGLLTGTGGDVYFVDPNKGAPRVQQYSVDLQRELPGGVSVSVGYTGLTGSNLSWADSGDALDQHQPDRSEVSEPADADVDAACRIRSSASRRPVTFADAATRSRSASCCGRSRSSRNVYMQQSTGAHSQYHAGDRPAPQARHRPVGRHLQLHLQPAERQPVRREQLLLERARPPEQLHRHPGLAVLQPGSGVRPQPARLAAQGRASRRRCCCRSARARSSCRTAASATRCSAAGRSRR